MTIYIFTGPTLVPGDARAELEAIYLPPVRQGDVYRVSQKRPQAIGIIDGYFERVPAVWHKEILWALKEGIYVFGSASMGALRAAELAPFGMEGVGAIFEAYRDGDLEADDEVAVAHASADAGYRAMSTAMVNIRCTLADAELKGVITPTTRSALERIAKDLFYPHRVYPLILQRGVEQGMSVMELHALRDWLPSNHVDQKRDDAVAMLRVMRQRLASEPASKQVSWSFQYTEGWDRLRCSAGEMQGGVTGDAETILLDMLLDELRLEGEAYVHAKQGALMRFLALEQTQRQNLVITQNVLVETVDTFRRRRALFEPEDMARWLEQHQLNSDQFLRLMEDEARVQWLETVATPEVHSLLLDYLRTTGDYFRLLDRARNKERLLEVYGLQNPGLEDCDLTERDLIRWYFEERLGQVIETDIQLYAKMSGFANQAAFMRALMRDYCYTMRTTSSNDTRWVAP